MQSLDSCLNTTSVGTAIIGESQGRGKHARRRCLWHNAALTTAQRLPDGIFDDKTMIRILAIHYSQTGQATRAAKSMLAPLEQHPDFEVIWHNVEPVTPYPFPWGFFTFFDTFPESVYLDAPAVKTGVFDPDAHYDLIVLAYQVWFLSPSLPITAFLQSPAARVLKGKPIITLIACRNMWLMAQQKIRARLAELGARLIDNVALIDQGPGWATFVTTPRWVLTGRKNAFWGIFPAAGVSDEEISAASRFGRAIVDQRHLIQSNKSLLSGLGAVKVNPGYIATERLAHRSFRMWGRLLRAIGKPGNLVRRAVLVVYVVFLILLILTVVPLGIIVRASLRPLLRKRMDNEVIQLELPSGSGTERIRRYAGTTD